MPNAVYRQMILLSRANCEANAPTPTAVENLPLVEQFRRPAVILSGAAGSPVGPKQFDKAARMVFHISVEMNTTFTKQLKTTAPVMGHMSNWQRMSCRFGGVGLKS